MALLDAMIPLLENEELSDFIIEQDLFVKPDVTEWVQGMDMLILKIGDETKKRQNPMFCNERSKLICSLL